MLCGTLAGVLLLVGSSVASDESLVFNEDFNTLDESKWSHTVTAWGGGNEEFQYYRNNRSNSYVRDGTLYLLPTLTSADYGEDFLHHGKLSYSDCKQEPCTSQAGKDIVLPIQSARIQTQGAFSFRYGRIEIRAKLPTGDWIWPAIWMMPEKDEYGGWPRSGEIDLVESRGNENLVSPDSLQQGAQRAGSTLHYGPAWNKHTWENTHWEKRLENATFGDDFHVYGMEWSEEGMNFTLDGEVLGELPAPEGGFWKFGGFDQDSSEPNPWAAGEPMAPFDKEFYIILNVAVGGRFFPDNWKCNGQLRPWNWGPGHPMRDFWEKRSEWLPTWQGEKAALQVDYVRVYQKK